MSTIFDVRRWATQAGIQTTGGFAVIAECVTMDELQRFAEIAIASAGLDAADMATASAQGFWDGVASLAANAGSEPVARVEGVFEFWWADHMPNATQAEAWREWCYLLRHGSMTATHPSPPEGMVGGWIALPGTLPEPGTPVLLDIGKKYPIRAFWAAKNTVRVGTDADDWGEYDEETDEYYCPEGWYEWNQQDEIHWAVTDKPIAWMPLPTTPSSAQKD